MNLKRRPRHERLPSHLANLARLSTQPPPSTVQQTTSRQSGQQQQPPLPSVVRIPPASPTHRCNICQTRIPLPLWEQHLLDPTHARKIRLALYNQALEDGSRDKFGVNIMPADLDFGVIDLSTLSSWPTRENVFYIRLEEGEARLENIRLTSRLGNLATFRDANFHVRFSAAITLVVGVMYAVKVTFDPKGNRGFYEDRVEFSFEVLSNGTKFAITRQVTATVTVEAHRRQLAPIAPYVRPQRRRRDRRGPVTDGTRPSSYERQKTAWVYRIPDFKVPVELNEMFEHGTVESRVERLERELGSEDVTYAQFWQTLLWAEEYQAHKDMENYDQTGVQFVGRFVEVPGLAERRPSVVIGDSVLVRPTDSATGRWFRGFVHGIQQSNVMLGFHASFVTAPGQRFDVEFELNRLLFQRQHFAMSNPYQKREILFPNNDDILAYRLSAPSQQEMNHRNIYDERVSLNPPQLQAATSIAQLPAGTIPFIIFGPPGTGKTVTVVEAIRQVLAQKPDAKILACAPSNNAADIIADRLRFALSPSELFRLNAPSRVKNLMPSLESYSARYDDGSFRVPAPRVIMQYRAVVVTCGSGSTPDGVGVPKGHFTHIFVDEAGQASEPEVMIPIKMNASERTTVVLAGDPKQLGPIIRSPMARRLGLEDSYLDRLMSMNLYSSLENRGVTYVKLTKNWRSHPAIIDFPNNQFYGGELEACAASSHANICLGWDKLPNPMYPVIFHAIKGQDLRESTSPSWFNIEEASAVRDYVRDLRLDPQLGLEDEQIGVITPYRAQVKKMRTVLHVDFPDVKVGTTEEFQGDERHAIIVSTVRSSLDFVEFDLRHTLGFVANPRRFNVAITRAKAILIIVGDPDVLGLDPLWRQYLNHIHANGGWRGIRIPWDPAEEVPAMSSGENAPRYDEQMRARGEQDLRDLVARISAMGLDALDEVEGLEADADLHWHEDE
ncbi:hypothetical protein M407DRAFT_80331 [Tulasnella calospora MUT 4182]|uniref:RNA helicase n=1 Tax=Tulasnella calospora MUT 4182 TaxID=1051891 RepID=A0A0C3QB43_9AGAM|nr:hypothetical protein M407DRAFT_80331 [Tulasnella calospora MUT 4182]